jgi:hypothetical protein
VHDWTLVNAGVFHGFHTTWIGQIHLALNGGLLPKGYYALPEQHAAERITDVLTLHESPDYPPPPFAPPIAGGTALAEVPPRVRWKRSFDQLDALERQRRTLAIRHVSGHRLIAMLEIISPANKDRPAHVEKFVEKAEMALEAGVHLLLVDLFPPGRHDPQGIHGAINERLLSEDDGVEDPISTDEPMTLASYAAGSPIECYFEQVGVGAALPPMPLFLQPDRYINAPLEETYQTSFKGMPAYWRDVLEGHPPPSS